MPAKGAGTIVGQVPSRVVVVGAGICGLAVAWRLAEAGIDVHVLDRGAAGREASWAAGGMLAAALEAEPGEEAMVALAHRSQALWTGYAARLARAGGIDVGYRDEGTLQVATTRDELAALRHRFTYLSRLGLPVAWWDAAALRDAEPGLTPDALAAIAAPGDHQVDPRAVMPALVAAVRDAGATIEEEREAVALARIGDRGWTVRLAGGEERPADAVVLAAGAWSAALDGLAAIDRPPVRPAKGQAIVLAMDPADPLVRRVIWGAGIYLVPRRDGRLYIGATVEDRGFERTPTAGGLLSLLESAWRVLPGLEELPVVELVTGLRPRSRDDLPIVGPSPLPGLHMATGHHRNGILLAPVTAEIVAAGILGGDRPPGYEAFSPARFAVRQPEAASAT
ncbi:MAG: glycine oxidase ThiO [Alphaproteobacteria bacterium]